MIIHMIKCPVCNEVFRQSDYVLVNELNTVMHLKCQNAYPFPLGIKEMGTFKTIQLQYEKYLPLKENQ